LRRFKSLISSILSERRFEPRTDGDEDEEEFGEKEDDDDAAAPDMNDLLAKASG